jgi:hypothetical protein
MGYEDSQCYPVWGGTCQTREAWRPMNRQGARASTVAFLTAAGADRRCNCSSHGADCPIGKWSLASLAVFGGDSMELALMGGGALIIRGSATKQQRVWRVPKDRTALVVD